MSYTFLRCRCSPGSDLNGWYIKLLPSDNELFQKIHKAVCSSIFQKFVVDPHNFENQDQTKPKHFIADLISVPKLGGGWVMTVEKMFHKYGAVFVNCAGGVMPPAKDKDILETLVSETFTFPATEKTENPFDNKEIIKVSQWPNAPHYYLSSLTQGRIFSPEKYDTFDEAYAVALKYTDKEHIRIVTHKVPKKKHEGD